MATDGFTLSVADLNKMDVPALPKKSNRDLTCAVIAKSPLKQIKNGSKMFTMTTSDEDVSTNCRAVCFDEEMFGSLEVSKTFCFSSYRIQRGYANRSKLEVVLDSRSKVEAAPKQFTMKPAWYDIATILRSNGEDMPVVNVKAKVTQIEEACLVGSPPDSKMRRMVYLTDNTGSLAVAFWREQIAWINFSDGDVVKAENLSLSTWNRQVSANASAQSRFTVVDEQMAITKAVLPKKSNVVSVEACVKGVKQFQTTCRCVGCNGWEVVSPTSEVITCQNSDCGTIFLASDSDTKKELLCMVLLNQPRAQWYTAFTQVNTISKKN